MTNAIVLNDVVKTFGSTTALDHLDLEVAVGEVHGYLGPNGSGKSVTIRTLIGLGRRDSGTARLLDGDPWRDAVELHRRIASGRVASGRVAERDVPRIFRGRAWSGSRGRRGATHPTRSRRPWHLIGVVEDRSGA